MYQTPVRDPCLSRGDVVAENTGSRIARRTLPVPSAHESRQDGADRALYVTY